ncbi:hypothetical protein [Actinomadura fibrosa]|uniref:Uncharacterized protein n=1 Tax=Actinomadura fibrosa TaxID=111802 RepID=A0ABW2XXY6_9ACTN|nr:hypothetical protein [Actinomadura fibrosa]
MFPRDVPEDEADVPAFALRQLDENVAEATARYPLTDFMVSMGCRSVVRAETIGDLELIAMVERIKADIARAAEWAAGRAMADHLAAVPVPVPVPVPDGADS